ncbi:alpha-amylase family glycosyl hydrolase [Bradyrhizobium japonicum]|uniref:alpha-amylase family glycosyl hydrolase n=1 Tax=Bradyrhizobium TaxID=374 RepID=UPI001FD9423D|nr:alpha-amylase family glycosyl hydrolase [Bradyrhizobium japonicum]
MTAASPDESVWWKSAVIYVIALISFQDSSGDGKGDLAGLTSRIDYLKWLGVDAIWLTPIYKSPFRDLGYDISDYCAVDPAFGSLDEFDRLVAALHADGIRLILELVPNAAAAASGPGAADRRPRRQRKTCASNVAFRTGAAEHADKP